MFNKLVSGIKRTFTPAGRKSADTEDTDYLLAIPPPSDPAWTYSDTGAPRQYQSATWIFACCSLIANELSSAKLLIKKRVGKQYEVVEDNNDKLYRLLQSPCDGFTQHEWCQARALHMLLTGSDYLLAERSTIMGRSLNRDAEGLPVNLWPYPEGPVSTDTETTGHRRVKEFKFRDGSRWQPVDVMRARFIRPGVDINKKGLSPLEAAAGELSIDQAAKDCQIKSFENRMLPDIAFRITKGGDAKKPYRVSTDQLNQTTKELMRAYAGMANARRPLVYANAEITELVNRLAEVDFLSTRKQSKDFICNAYKVPTVIFDAANSKFANLETALFYLWYHAVIPLNNILISTLNRRLAPEYGDYQIAADYTTVDAMLPIMKARLEVAKGYVEMGVPVKQVAAKFNLGIDAFSGWEIGHIPSNRIAADTFGGVI